MSPIRLRARRGAGPGERERKDGGLSKSARGGQAAADDWAPRPVKGIEISNCSAMGGPSPEHVVSTVYQ